VAGRLGGPRPATRPRDRRAPPTVGLATPGAPTTPSGWRCLGTDRARATCCANSLRYGRGRPDSRRATASPFEPWRRWSARSTATTARLSPGARRRHARRPAPASMQKAAAVMQFKLEGRGAAQPALRPRRALLLQRIGPRGGHRHPARPAALHQRGCDAHLPTGDFAGDPYALSPPRRPRAWSAHARVSREPAAVGRNEPRVERGAMYLSATTTWCFHACVPVGLRRELFRFEGSTALPRAGRGSSTRSRSRRGGVAAGRRPN